MNTKSQITEEFPKPDNVGNFESFYGLEKQENGVLYLMNKKIKEDADEYCDGKDTSRNRQKCLNQLFSAPANLRYGYGGINLKISDHLDLMGDKNGEITHHEAQLIRFYERNYARVKCHEHPVYCEEDEDKKVRYLLSSTSAKWNGRVIQNTKNQGANIHLVDYESLYSNEY